VVIAAVGGRSALRRYVAVMNVVRGRREIAAWVGGVRRTGYVRCYTAARARRAAVVVLVGPAVPVDLHPAPEATVAFCSDVEECVFVSRENDRRVDRAFGEDLGAAGDT